MVSPCDVRGRPPVSIHGTDMSASSPEPTAAPAAVLRGWLIWSVCAVMFAYAFFHRVAPGVMFDRLMRDFHVGAAVLGNLSACYLYAYAAMQIPVGVMLDRIGPRLILAGSGVAAAGGSLLFAADDTLVAAYAGRLLIGAGTGVVFISTLKIAMDRLPARRFALVTGLTQAIAMCGAVLGQAPLALLIEAVGWRATMVWGAGLGALLAAGIWLAARPPAGDGTGPRRDTVPRRRLGGDIRLVCANRQFWLAALYSAGSSGPMLAFAVLWGVPYLVQVHGLERSAAGAGASVMLIGWAAAAPAIGWLSDRMGRRKPLMVATAALVLLLWAAVLWLPTLPLAMLYVLLAAIGALSASMALTFAVGREVTPPGVQGLATGLVNLASIGFGALLQPSVGWLLDRQWEGAASDGARLFDQAAYVVAFLPFPAAAAASLLAALGLRETYCRVRSA